MGVIPYSITSPPACSQGPARGPLPGFNGNVWGTLRMVWRRFMIQGSCQDSSDIGAVLRSIVIMALGTKAQQTKSSSSNAPSLRPLACRLSAVFLLLHSVSVSSFSLCVAHVVCIFSSFSSLLYFVSALLDSHLESIYLVSFLLPVS